MRHSGRFAFPALVLAFLMLTAAMGATVIAGNSDDDRVIGTWKLNLAKSKFATVPAPHTQTRVYENDPKGIRATITTVDQAGNTTVIKYVAAYDSVEYPLT